MNEQLFESWIYWNALSPFVGDLQEISKQKKNMSEKFPLQTSAP